jgi:predicted Zn-dependent protease
MNPRMSQLLEFLKEAPEDPFLNYALAQEHMSAGNREEARRLLEWLLQHHPDYVASYYHLGKLLEKEGQKEAAMEVYETGISIAGKLGEQHARAELQSAKLELEYGD